MLNDNFSLKDGGYSNSENTVNLPRHRWYYYKEGFSPFLVEKAIEQTGIDKDDIILDPFNGGGTTTLTAASLGLKSVGIEVNPFTAFLSKTKTKNIKLKELKTFRNELIESPNSAQSNLLGYSTFSEKEGLEKWLFNDSVLNTFESKYQLINKLESRNLRDILKLALVSSAMENCNAKRDGKCFRYRKGWENNGFNEQTFLRSLEKNLNVVSEDIEKKTILQKPEIYNGDSRRVLTSKKISNYKLCVTSPPYLNTFDYTDIYRPELFLGKFVTNSAELYDLRLKTVRSHIQAKWKEPTLMDFGLLYDNAISHVNSNVENLMHKNIPLMIQAYFEDMHRILTTLRYKATADAQLWFVVSNSAYAGMEIPVDLIIGEIGTKVGWYLKEIGVLRYISKRKTKHSPEIKELRESVIIFSKTK